MQSLLTVNTDIKNKVFVNILLDNKYEMFELNLKNWSKNDYVNQWKDAARYSLENRCVSGLIKNYESSINGVKKINIFIIIPEEVNDPKSFIFQRKIPEDFYITESFVFVTENIDTFLSNESYERIKEIYGDYFPIIYFDQNFLFRFYLYLSDRVEGISNWKIKGSMIKTILEL